MPMGFVGVVWRLQPVNSTKLKNNDRLARLSQPVFLCGIADFKYCCHIRWSSMILAKAFTTSGLRLVLRNSSSEETLILSLLRNGLQRGIYCVLRKKGCYAHILYIQWDV